MVINYHRGTSQRGEFVTPQLATELLKRHINPLFQVLAVRKLYGGTTSRVLELTLDREPGSLVAKVHDHSASSAYAAEIASLRFLCDHTHFPVPIPFACIEHDPHFDGSMLILQKINGVPLAGATMTPQGKLYFQAELAAAIAELHRFEATHFGPAAGQRKHGRWIDYYGPTVERTVKKSREILPSSSRPVLDHVVKYLDQWLGHNPVPTLIHGDLWANNILLDDSHPDRPRILAFIDTVATYADPEYELSYLQLFGTAGDTFFNTYRSYHEIDEGYTRRSRVYWLIMLLHNASRYGEQYIHQVEKVIAELRRIAS